MLKTLLSFILTFLFGKIFSQAVKPVVLISGKVVDERTMRPLGAKIVWEVLPEGKEAGIARSNPKTGEYKIVLPQGKKYSYMALLEGYYSVTKYLDLTNLDDYIEIDEQNLYLAPVMIDQVIRLNNIFFKDGTDELLPESYCELDRFVAFLKINKRVEGEIGGHTDNIGDPQQNLILSEKRAKKIMEYCISKGINPKRLTAKGYGQTQPISFNKDEEGRAMNRRIEFKITNIKEKKFLFSY